MENYLVKAFIIFLCLIVSIGCTDPDLSKSADNTGLQEGEIIEFQGKKIKVGDLSDQDISQGITRDVSIVSLDENETTKGAPAGARYLTIIVRDGASNSKNVYLNMKYMRNIAVNEGKILGYGCSYIAGGCQDPGDTIPDPCGSPTDAEEEILYWKSWWATKGVNQYSTCVLLVGKSVGAAMLYRSLYRCYSSKSPYIGLQNFFKVAVVLVDAHEPGAPGDSGYANKWYDYVYFDKSMGSGSYYYYNLKFWSAWAPYINPYRKGYSQLAIYNTYERHPSESFRGYSFNGLYNSKYYSMTNIKQNERHRTIGSSNITGDVIYNTFVYFCMAKD
jgi:hypothetical protein